MTLLLDPDIRDWVVLPLFVIIVVAGLLRQAVSLYLQGSKSGLPEMAQRTHNLQKYVSRLQSPSAHSISNFQWAVYKQHCIELLNNEAERLENSENESSAQDPMEAMMSNPLSMMGGNMVFMVQNMVMMQGIQHFFSGFILLKVPFPLTVGFKNMFQKGVANLPDLEPSYVSSVSWYFLVLYGLRSFFKLAIGTPNFEQKEQEMFLYKIGLQNPPNNPAKKQDAQSLAKNLKSQAEALELVSNFKSELDTVEKRLLGKRYPKKKIASSSQADFLLGKKKSKKRQ